MAPTFPIIVCRHEDYNSAGAAFGSVRDGGTEVHSALVRTLTGYAGMAGTDDAGTEWATAYDEAVDLALKASAKLVAACGRTGDLLIAGAYNHASGEAGANLGAVSPPATPTLSSEPCLALFTPSASGASGDEPFGWSLVKAAAGLAWPDGHQDQLREAKTVWYDAAAALGNSATPIPGAIGLLENQQSPEIPNAIRTCNEMGVDLDQLASSYRAIGDACGEYAQHLDDAHHEILAELRQMLIETAAVESVISVGAFFTAGLSELGNFGVAARISMYTARIGRIITELVAKVAVVARRVSSVISSPLKAMFARLGRWLEQAVAKIWRGNEAAPQLFSRSAARTNMEVLEHGGDVAMTEESIIALAQKAGIDMTGVEINIVRDTEQARYLDYWDACAQTPTERAGRQIRFGPASFMDEETMVATIAHEMTHVRQLREGVDLGTGAIRDLEAEAYASEAGPLARFRGAK
ncbi:hypothetical protein DFR70_110228 [Nocardia tenerifensis]|uniref:Outer membrane channel protein CpnT-like N-terminal domain-containing protein n=1 Tax=Nocardia tenerifensis TaxID=228006 RepID=A0A318K050_9NOCA|nr:hypothetical protein [Nocardia tenerifensis]PXX60386.1 hypothetical protein DFR70_110228 [Nocardia tenerifensis]